jgi:hypothetical protein
MTIDPFSLVDIEQGLVHRQIFADDEIYRLELERIFARCWLFLGHESQVARPGDFITTWMGNEPVIVARDTKGEIHAISTPVGIGATACVARRRGAPTRSCAPTTAGPMGSTGA